MIKTYLVPDEILPAHDLPTWRPVRRWLDGLALLVVAFGLWLGAPRGVRGAV